MKPDPAELIDRFNAHAREWGVTIDDARRSESSFIGFGHRDGLRVVLKVARTKGEEWRSGEFLAAFNGRGMIKALERAEGAVLLERLTPGQDLTTLSLNGRDDEATQIIAGIIERMCAVSPTLTSTIAAETLAPDFERFRHSCDALMPAGMVECAELVCRELCASQSTRRLLHGDLHHANVLFDSRQGWVAIDPWGIMAELEFEVGAALRNPISAPHLLADGATLVRRLDIYTERLKFNRDRALRWAFAATVLAALWPTDESLGGIDMRIPFITAASTMQRII